MDESILLNDALDLLVLVGSNIKLSGLRWILPNYDGVFRCMTFSFPLSNQKSSLADLRYFIVDVWYFNLRMRSIGILSIKYKKLLIYWDFSWFMLVRGEASKKKKRPSWAFAEIPLYIFKQKLKPNNTHPVKFLKQALGSCYKSQKIGSSYFLCFFFQNSRKKDLW